MEGGQSNCCSDKRFYRRGKAKKDCHNRQRERGIAAC